MAEAAKKTESSKGGSAETKQKLVEALLAHILALHGEANGGQAGKAEGGAQAQQAQPQAQEAAAGAGAPQMPQAIHVVHHISR